jgi:hypothetical protein
VPAAAPKPQPAARAKFWAERPAAPRPRTLGGVDLGGDALLVLPQVPTDADAAAIRAAARPLIDLLAQRGLINHLSAETTE